MKKITYRPVYNRKKTLNKQGMALIQIEAYLEKKKTYFSTGIYLTPEQWDKRKCRIKQHPNAEALNYRIHELMLNLEQKEIRSWKQGCTITLDVLKEETPPKASSSFLDFVKEDISTSPIKPSTRKNRMTTCLLLQKFNPSIGFKDVTPHFIYDFEKYLFDNNLQTNTVAKHMKHLKSFVNSAIDKEHIDINDYAFRRYRIKTKSRKHVFLLPEELKKMENLVLPQAQKPLSHSLDAFLFCCYTGLRYSDFVNLTESNIVRINQKPWIIFRTVKTDTEVKLPLHLLFGGKAWLILRKYKGSWNDFFSIKPNSNVNKDLIKIGRLAGIKKHFSFHTARHTNATLLIYMGASITTVQKLLGHRNVSTTQVYSEIMQSTIVKDLTACSTTKRTR